MKALYMTRVNDIAYCERELMNAAAKAEKDCVKEIKEFQSFRKKERRIIEGKDIQERGDEDEYGLMLLARLDKLENRLMEVEMSLQQKLNEGYTIFEDRLK
jgi:hypothetical protein